MSADYRELTDADLEQANNLEATAFYHTPTPARLEILRRFYPPEWTVGAFVGGKLVADVRTTPMARRMNGDSCPFGLVGPVTCLPEYRRQGHVAELMRMSISRMRDSGLALSGLHTPHDALYARFGYERAEGKKRYVFHPKEVRLRLRPGSGSIQRVTPDDWQRLDAIYRSYGRERNGPIHRIEPWWTERLMRNVSDSGERTDCESFVWVSADGVDEGYVIYMPQSRPADADTGNPADVAQTVNDILVRDTVALNSHAYLGIWQHLLNHDLAHRIVIDVSSEDPLLNLVEDPWKVQTPRPEGAMIRIIDLAEAVRRRPHCGESAASFTLAITDRIADWNEGHWRIEAAEGSMNCERTDDEPDAELSIGALAPIYTGFMRPSVAANAGLLNVKREGVIAEMTDAFTVSHPPFSHDYY